MQDFHCNYIKNKYGDKTEMLLTDTASLMYKTKAENVYDDFYNNKELYDLRFTQKIQNITLRPITWQQAK